MISHLWRICIGHYFDCTMLKKDWILVHSFIDSFDTDNCNATFGMNDTAIELDGVLCIDATLTLLSL